MKKEEVEKKVVDELREKNLKLWLPPYVHDDESTTRPNHDSIEELAASMVTSSLNDCTKEQVIDALLSWQAHALEKLKEKKKNSVACLDIKVLGLTGDVPQDTSLTSTESWAERIEILPKAVKLHHLNPKLTVRKFLEELQVFLKVSSFRLSHKGKPMTPTNGARLAQVLLQENKVPKHGGVKTTILCQVTSQRPPPETTLQSKSPEQVLIQSIRHAATKLSGSANIDIMDQQGRHVPMLASDRHAFLTALGLHSLGRKRMDSGNYESALIFLLQANDEWNNVATEWRDRVDNYGILQLDIAWTYLKLESSERLEDATRRLQVAETVLCKQVNSNFLTLALAMADMGKQVPPLAAVFCRLFLLQGVAYRYSNNVEKANEKLEWAWQVCSSLRSVSSPEAVSSLCEAMVGISQSQAISALRRTNGNLDQAAELLQQDKASALEQHYKREEQRKLGLCQNTMDYVDIEVVTKLQNVLDISSPRGVAALSQQVEDVHHQVAVGLMRLANNNVEKAIDIYQDVERSSEAVLQQVLELDQKLENQGLETPKQNKKRSRPVIIAVDDVALATLVSMGVQEPLAKKALRASENNVDASLVWLTRKDDESAMQEEEEEEEPPAAGEDVDMANAINGLNDESLDDANEGDEEETSHVDQEKLEFEQAMELLQRELGEALQDRDMEKEYLGSSLDEEWEYLEKFVGSPATGSGDSSK